MNGKRPYNWLKFHDISAGANSTFGLTTGGDVWAWGNGVSGHLGTNTSMVARPLLYDQTDVQVGSANVVSLGKDSKVTAWGVTLTYTNGYIPDRSSPVSVIGGHSFVSVVIGRFHSGALKADGTAWTWGRNADGQLGTLSLSDKSSPVSVVGDHSFVSMIPGAFSTYGLKADGTVWAWGRNTEYQLGDLTGTGKSSPVSVAGNNSFIAIAPGASHVVAVKADGHYWAWGNHASGQLGIVPGSSSPISVVGNHSFINIAGGQDFATALKADGSAWAWGINIGNLGDLTGASKSSPISVVGNHSFTYLVNQDYVALGLKQDGTCWAWGQATDGRLGDNTAQNKSSPISVVGNHSFIYVATCGLTANGATYALKQDGTVWAWGTNSSVGQLGDNTLTNRSSPVSVIGNHSFIFIGNSSGANGSALKADGTAWMWGNGGSGQLGNNTKTSRSSPVPVVGNHSFISLVSARITSYGLKADGRVWAWGDNAYGALGDNTIVSKSSPVPVVGNHSFIKIIAGRDTAGAYSGFCAGLKSDGTVWAWGGAGNIGFLGNNNTITVSSPVSAVGNHSFINISSNGSFVLGLKSDGTIWSWGSNYVGALGNLLSESNFSAPTIGAEASFVNVFSGYSHSLGLKSDGTVWAWGLGASGQLGSNITASTSQPISVVGNHSFVFLQGGSNHSYGLKSDGTVWSWGLGGSGQLGDLTASSKSSPVSVVGNHSFISVTIGSYYDGAGLKSDGTVWTWGVNTFGEIGNQTAGAYSSPVSVVGNHSFISLTSGYGSFSALKSDGTAWGWGYNVLSQLGNNTTTNMSSPVSVVGNHSFVQIKSLDNSVYTLKSDGTMWAWGQGIYGELGDNSLVYRSSPVSVVGNHSFALLGAGAHQLFALKSDGSAWGCGFNQAAGQETVLYQLGNGIIAGSPRIMMPMPSYKKMISGVDNMLAIDSKDRLYGWGFNGLNNLNTLTGNPMSSPILSVNAQNNTRYGGRLHKNSFADIYAGGYSSAAKKPDGTMWTWGQNYYNVLGRDYLNYNEIVPDIIERQRISHIAISYSYSLIIKTDGTCWAWGANISGQLGNNSTTATSSPVSVIGNHSFIFASTLIAGTSLALKADGTCWAWGEGTLASLGDGTLVSKSSPVSVVGNHSFVSIVSNYYDISALKADGTCWCWGRGAGGQLGDNTTNTGSSPVSVVGNHSFIQIAAGIQNKYALKADGTVWAWGYGSNGSLGDNTTTNKSSPVSVVGNHSFIQISAGGQTNGSAHCFGLKANGQVWGWGHNYVGQLACGTVGDGYSSPVSVQGNHSFVKITTAEWHSLGLKADGTVWAWGRNSGTFGNGRALGWSFEWSAPQAVIPTLVNYTI